MTRHSITRPLLILASMAAIVEAQAPAIPEGRQYKVAFWFEMDRPFSTVRYRAYDVAKGEYDPVAVDRWLKAIFADHPRYGATVRDLSTIGEPGATEAERLDAAVRREKRRRVELNLRTTGPVPKLVGPATPPGKSKGPAVDRTSFDRPSPGDPRTPDYPSASPYPYPYRARPL